MGQKPRIGVFYHYYYPDDVISARHYQDFCEDLAARGWEVEVFPSNRGCRDEKKRYPLREEHNGVAIRRIWRPPLKQRSHAGRILNALWMLAGWSFIVFRSKKKLPCLVVVGTDPILGVLIAAWIKWWRPSVKVVHWCYDLDFEGAIVEGILPKKGFLVNLIRAAYSKAYADCDLIADLGPCMRKRLEAYPSGARRVTLTPWAISEPPQDLSPDREERAKLFGDAKIGLLYSGNFGFSHSYREILELARRLSGRPEICFCFGVRGNSADELYAAIKPEDKNVRKAPFADESSLEKRLAAADIHLVSLKPDRTGLVMPSKFFGSLAAGRPVLFAGSEEAGIARWIREYGVGWVLTDKNIGETAALLSELADRPEKMAEYRRRCRSVYAEFFSRSKVMQAWDEELGRLAANGGLSA